MQEHSILMTTEMVKAILEGRKTQTRRVIIPQPSCDCSSPNWQGQIIDWKGYKHEGKQGWFCYTCGSGLRHIDEYSAHGIICPYGQVGDRLWVRERFGLAWMSPPSAANCHMGDADPLYPYKDKIPKQREDNLDVCYYADDTEPDGQGYWPSIFMPRWASRIDRDITGLRVERVQDISEEDAMAEGCQLIARTSQPFTLKPTPHYTAPERPFTYRDHFIGLWDFINEKRGYSFESNPLVWVPSWPKYELS